MDLRIGLAGFVLFACFVGPIQSQQASGWKDTSPHTTRFVDVEKNVRLEVLDWGGTGDPMLLLAGGGHTAHVFDNFAPKLTAHNHVYGMTRRGFGASGFAAAEDPGERLGEDVLAVIDSLKFKKAILVGHSFAGMELSWMANRHPERVAGLVYLEAGYSYAFDNGKGAEMVEMMKLQSPVAPPPGPADLASFKALQAYDERVDGYRMPEAELRQQREAAPDGLVGKYRDDAGGALLMKVIQNPKKYTAIPAPALFIFADPHGQGAWADKSTDPAVKAAAKAYSAALDPLVEKQEKSVKEGLPGARVVIIPGAHHLVFLSNEDQVLKEMRGFLAGLK
jgi:non-heme chloroperoxidase